MMAEPRPVAMRFLLHICEVPTPMTAMTKQMKTNPWIPPPMRTPISVTWVYLRIMPMMSRVQVMVSANGKGLEEEFGSHSSPFCLTKMGRC